MFHFWYFSFTLKIGAIKFYLYIKEHKDGVAVMVTDHPLYNNTHLKDNIFDNPSVNIALNLWTKNAI